MNNKDHASPGTIWKAWATVPLSILNKLWGAQSPGDVSFNWLPLSSNQGRKLDTLPQSADEMENQTFDFTVSGRLDLSWSGTDCTKPSLQTPYFGPDMNGLWFTNRENISENSSKYDPRTIFMGSEKESQCELEYCTMVGSISFLYLTK